MRSRNEDCSQRPDAPPSAPARGFAAASPPGRAIAMQATKTPSAAMVERRMVVPISARCPVGGSSHRLENRCREQYTSLGDAIDTDWTVAGGGVEPLRIARGVHAGLMEVKQLQALDVATR